MKKPTLKDVAREAGVSSSTVSLVFTGKGKISARVREQVLDTGARLGYRKTAPSFTPSKRSTAYVAVLNYLSWDYEWYFTRPFLHRLETRLNDEGCFPLMMNVPRGSDAGALLQKILASNAGGVCSIHFIDVDLFSRLESVGIPVVIINNSNVQDRFSSVCVDDFQGAYEGALHLISLGHRAIAYVEYTRHDAPRVVEDRFVGFKKAVDENGLSFQEDMRVTVDLADLEELRVKIGSLLRSGKPPTAVFAHDDYIAARVVSILQGMGVAVPEDMSIIAPGDTLAYDETFTPPITTMRIDTEIMGKLAGDLIVSRLRDGTDDLQVLKVKQQLVERGSCRRIMR